MGKSIRVYGEFLLSTSLAEQVREAVAEVLQGNRLRDLSHLDNDCHLCRTTPDPEPVARIPKSRAHAVMS